MKAENLLLWIPVNEIEFLGGRRALAKAYYCRGRLCLPVQLTQKSECFSSEKITCLNLPRLEAP